MGLVWKHGWSNLQKLEYLCETCVGSSEKYPQLSSGEFAELSGRLCKMQHLAHSRSSEIRLLCRVAASDIRSTLSKNCRNISDEFGINPWVDSPKKIRFNYKYYSIPEMDSWRIPLMNTLLRERFELDALGEETYTVNELIASLCST